MLAIGDRGDAARHWRHLERSDERFFYDSSEMLRRLAPQLSGIGFKILSTFSSLLPASFRFAELPYRFRARSLGTSKMDAKVALEFVELLLEKAVGHIVPAKFVIFSVVGTLGVVVHLFVLTLVFKGMGIDFESGQIAATLVAMTSNFALNNALTYYDRRLSGWEVDQRLVQLRPGVVNRSNRQCWHRHVFILRTGNSLAAVGGRGCAGGRRLELYSDCYFYMETNLTTDV